MVGEILRCSDQWGRLIVLTDDRWTDHSLLSHPELSGQELAVAQVLSQPDAVTYDKRHVNGENFYSFGVLAPPLERVYLKVCVRFTLVGENATALGAVITAFPISEIRRTEVRRWP